MNFDKIEKLKQHLPVKITAISPQKKRKDRFSLFHDGKFLLGISGSTLLFHKIQEGTELNHSLLNDLLGDEEYQAVKDACFRYLSSRDHSAYELNQKVSKKGFDPGFISQVIEELIEKDLINDKRFAEKFAADKMEFNKWGPSKIQSALINKGISQDIARNVTQILTDSLEQHGICVDLLRKRKAHFLRETDILKRRQKMYRFLAGKGFHGKDITRALGEVKSEFNVK